MSDQQQQIYVECYAGYRAEETPRRFFIDERVIDIIEVLERGLTPEYREFKVRGDDGVVYLLRQDLLRENWALISYEPGGDVASQSSG